MAKFGVLLKELRKVLAKFARIKRFNLLLEKGGERTLLLSQNVFHLKFRCRILN